MSAFTYDDVVRVSDQASAAFRPGAKGWVIAVITDREKIKAPQLPPGNIYTIEYEDGVSVDVHETDLNMWEE
jgi:hypothetical protein